MIKKFQANDTTSSFKTEKKQLTGICSDAKTRKSTEETAKAPILEPTQSTEEN